MLIEPLLYSVPRGCRIQRGDLIGQAAQPIAGGGIEPELGVTQADLTAHTPVHALRLLQQDVDGPDPRVADPVGLGPLGFGSRANTGFVKFSNFFW